MHGFHVNSYKTKFKMKLMKLTLLVLVSTAILSCGNNRTEQKTAEMSPIVIETPARPEGQNDVFNLTAPKMDIVRVGIIGLGMRGPGAVDRLSYIEGVEIKALCDIHRDRVEKSNAILAKHGKPAADGYYGSEEAWKQLCEREDIDLVYICTDWKTHTPMAVYAMEHGKHVACEVPIAISIDECWALVNTAEKTRKHCMMLENCCYDFFEMTTLNMAQKGLLGEIVHAEGAYIHDLRYLNFLDPKEGGYNDWWRLRFNETHNGNYYATHGLGPVCQALNIGRGDRMKYLVAMASDQFGMTEYAKEKFGEDSEMARKNYAKGDMINTLIKTENGKTILIQHDVTSPRPYNRKHALSGTKGYIEKYPRPGIALEPNEELGADFENLNAHSFLPEKEFDKMVEEYEHPITKEVGELARKVGGHGGMDFIMDYRLIYCLRNGLPLDMNVYDGVEWSCIGELTAISIKNGSVPVLMPDFTRGAWKKASSYTHAMAEKQ